MSALNLIDSLLKNIDKKSNETTNDYDDSNIFKSILDGKIPCYKIFENDDCIAILDAFPMCDGHSLLISKVCKKSIQDFTCIESGNYLQYIPKLCNLVKKATNADGVNVLSNVGKDAGQAVFHAHFHVIPRFKNDGLIKLGKSSSKMISKDKANSILNKMGVQS